MKRPSFLLLTGIIASASSAIAAYDGSWTNSYTWTEAVDQTVTSAPTVPTIYRGNTVFKTKVGGTGNATVAIFSGGTVDVQGLSSENALLKDDNGVFRLAVVDNATVTLSKQQYWYGKDCHFELVDGNVTGTGGILLGSSWFNKDDTIDIYGGTWTAPVQPNNWTKNDLDDKQAIRIYGGVFAPSSLLPKNSGSGYQFRISTVVMAGGTFICPSMKMNNGNHSRATWFTAEKGTSSILKLGATSVVWAGVLTMEEASAIRLQQNVPGREECLGISTNVVGSGEIRIEGASLDLSNAICDGFTGTLALKSGKLELGSGKRFGEGAKIVLDYPKDSHILKPITWADGEPPQNVTFELNASGAPEDAYIRQVSDGVCVCPIRHVYDGSWTNDYTWTEAVDQTVTSAPTVPTIYRGNTVFKTKVGGSGNADVAIFSGGTVDVQGLSSENALLKDDYGVFRLAVVDNATVTLSKQQYWYGKDCHFELVDGNVTGAGGILLGSSWFNKDDTIDIYGGTWTAPVQPNNWTKNDLDDKQAIRIYGGVFAPSSLLPKNSGSGYQFRISTVVMAGGTFICPSMKMNNGNHSRATWFTAEKGTSSILKLGATSVVWAGVLTMEEASAIRLQQNVPGREECLSIATNIVGSGEIRIEGASLDLSNALCDGFTGAITLKSGGLELGSDRKFGEGAKIVLDYPERTCSFKAVSWTRGAAPEGVTFILSDALKQKHCSIEIEADGVRLLSNRGFSLTVR